MPVPVTFEAFDNGVEWIVAEGYRPIVGEALDRLAHLRTYGDSNHVLGREFAKDAHLWRTLACRRAAA
jgi:hypothetical protein